MRASMTPYSLRTSPCGPLRNEIEHMQRRSHQPEGWCKCPEEFSSFCSGRKQGLVFLSPRAHRSMVTQRKGTIFRGTFSLQPPLGFVPRFACVDGKKLPPPPTKPRGARSIEELITWGNLAQSMANLRLGLSKFGTT